VKDPAEQLQALYVAGFDLEQFERYPKAIGIVRGECMVLLVPGGPEGLQMLGTPGWKIGAELAVLTTVAGRQVFQFKDNIVEATPERLEQLAAFRGDVVRILKA